MTITVTKQVSLSPKMQREAASIIYSASDADADADTDADENVFHSNEEISYFRRLKDNFTEEKKHVCKTMDVTITR